MVLHNLMMQVTRVAGMNYYSPNLPETQFFFPPPKHNYDLGSTTQLAKLSGCIGPIRRPIEIPNPSQYRIILHLRDPRDVLTSLFFSHCYSHFGWENREQERAEWIQAGIDKFVLDKSYDYAARYDAYCNDFFGKPNVTFLTYEEMVRSFETWLAKFLVPFPRPQSDQITKNIVSQYKDAFRVSSEDITQHKRKVTPGDHREKLQPATIHALNQIFSHSLEKLGYQT